MMKKTISIIMTLVLMLSTLFSVSVSAATDLNYPTISSSKYIEFRAQQKINVYKDTACKTRGTSSPSKKYNASISKGDDCYIYKITSSYIQVNYPLDVGGRSTGYIKRADLFDKTTPEEYISSAKAKVTVYKSTSGSYIAKGDKVWRVDPKNGYSGYRAVIYEAKSGKRAYKMGYITLDDLDKIRKTSSNNSKSYSKTDIQKKIISILYNGQGGKVSCDFDGYVNTSGRHEGIDFVYKSGKAIYSVIDGVVTASKKSSGGLTTTAIYNKDLDITVIYLHHNIGVKTGANVKVGQKIGTEGNNAGGSAHTHIEIRKGKKTSASKSVNDYSLDNPNPYPYWEKILNL